jgi:hypothetical protein
LPPNCALHADALKARDFGLERDLNRRNVGALFGGSAVQLPSRRLRFVVHLLDGQTMP